MTGAGTHDDASRAPSARPAVVSAGQLAAHLAAWSDDALVELLARRPDLASPSPSSLLALAARAASRASVERALATLDAEAATVAEAVVALDGASAPTGDADAPELPTERVAHATGLAEPDAAASLERLATLALTVDGRALPAVTESFGHHPAGLGPAWAQVADGEPAAHPQRVLAQAPPAARGTVDAMLWGPPVGTTRTERLPEGAAWLVEHRLLARPDAHRVVLPREVALALREGRTHRDPPAPPRPHAAPRAAASIEAESAQAAGEFVRHVAELLAAWREHPAAVLRSGGIGVREMKRTAGVLGVSEERVALLAEVAAAAGLLWRSEADPVEWAPSREADPWIADELPGRWVTLAANWLVSARTPAHAGGRDATGTLRAALGPTLDAAWAPRLRAEALALLAAHPGCAVTAEDVARAVAFHRPRLPDHAEEVPALLAEFAELGITGAGALAPGALALARGEGELAAAEAFARTLPQQVDELVVQGDLSAIVPGPPTPALAALLAASAEVESLGSALTARFTSASIRRALDEGRTADQLLDDLRSYSRGPLPQPLEYLIGDVARRHGTIRLGAAGTYLRSQTPEALMTLLGHPELADLELRQIAPGVVVSPESPDVVARTLRFAGLAPVVEDAEGRAVPTGGGPARGGGGAAGASSRPGGPRWTGLRRRGGEPEREPTFPGRADLTAPAIGALAGGAPARGTEPAFVREQDDGLGGDPARTRDREALHAIIAHARAGDAAVREAAEVARAGGIETAPDPVVVIEALRSAVAQKTTMDVVLVGAGGATQERRVLPVAVEQGRARLRDEAREVEITVALPRVASAVPASPPSP